ncbi:MAG: cyclic nucleotide-binding and patatin-like phospholipase domain-containing protein [Bacteroidota bacterium]
MNTNYTAEAKAHPQNSIQTHPDAATVIPLIKAILHERWGNLDEVLLDQIIHHLEWEILNCGIKLYQEGEIGDCMHILISGRLKAFREESGQLVGIGEISAGECVGETSLIAEAPRNASIYVIRDSILVKMNKMQFDAICQQHPQLLKQVAKVVIQRFSNPDGAKQKLAAIKNVALFPVDETVDMEAFTTKLIEQLSHQVSTQVFDKVRMNERLSTDGLDDFSEASLSDLHFYNWQEKIEQESDLIIYQAAHDDSFWTQTCIRQADMILLVGDFYEREKSAVETNLFERTNKLSYVSRHLVLLHKDANRLPENTAHHLDLREVDLHHHIRWEKEGDFARLSRFITGKTIGLVLAGGGAKGLAHVGVYQRLKEEGIEIDMLGGTSIGAAIAGAIAMDLSVKELVEKCRDAFVVEKPLSKRALPLVSFISDTRLNRVMKKHYGNRNIEDQWLNFFCVSSNYSHPATIIHKRGKFWKAIRASLSIPGALPPVVEGNDLLVDGGLMNNFPIDIMTSYNIGKIIGVSLSKEKEYQLNYQQIPHSRKLLQNKFVSKKKRIKVPSLVSIIFKSTILASYEKSGSTKQLADVLIHPPVARFGLLDFKKFDAIYKIGYEHTDELLKTEGDLFKCLKVV